MADLKMTEETANDLGYLRNLAEAGQHAPLLGGRFAIMWGVLFSAALITQWLVLTGQAPFGSDKLGFVWIGMIITGWIGSTLLVRSLKGKPGAGSVGNRAESVVWSAGGFAIFVYWLAVMASVLVGKADYVIFDTILIVAFCIYGICYFATGGLSGNRSMYVIGALCFIAAIINGALIHQPLAYLISAGFVVLVTIVPGIISMRQEPSQIV